MKQQLHAPNAGRTIWLSTTPVMAKYFTPVIATRSVSLPLTSNPQLENALSATIRYSPRREPCRVQNTFVPVNGVESRFRRNNNANNNLQGDAIVTAIDVLNEERVIAYPTEAVFGVGCDPGSETAVMRLSELKQRPVDKRLVLITASYEQLRLHIDDTIPTDAQCETIFSRWPGSITFVFPAPMATPRWLAGRFGSLAIRVTDHPLVVALCQVYGKSLVSTSANLSGLPSCRTVDEVCAQFDVAFSVVPGETGGCSNSSEICGALAGELFRQG